jgi:hypothetical protein
MRTASRRHNDAGRIVLLNRRFLGCFVTVLVVAVTLTWPPRCASWQSGKI